MDTPLLSVIIPVYNTEKYLSRCLDSVCNQTYTNIEIITVNDGSPDKSIDILNKYANNDDRIIVLEKENGGLSSARNMGLSKASGEWITFLDSDDWVDHDYYNELMHYSNLNNDMICGSFCINQSEKIHKVHKTHTSLNRLESISLLYDTYYGMIYNVWGKLFKKDIICNHNIIFRLVLREDGIFLLDYYKYTNSISVVSNSTYLHYNTENNNSITHKTHGIKKVMHILFTYYNSFNNLIEIDYSNYDAYTNILNKDKTRSFCEILHETYALPIKEKLYWYRRMIEELPKFVLSETLNKPIYKWLKLAFITRSSFLFYFIIKWHLLYNRILYKIKFLNK